LEEPVQSTPPLDARRPVPHAASTASTLPAEPEPGDSVLGIAHCCPHCGRPLAVVNVLVPVEEPPGPEQPGAESHH
jgi:hypothetical protein